MDTIKPEAGKKYKTRDGDKAAIVAVNDVHPITGKVLGYPALGYIEGRDDESSWCMDGRYYNGDGVEGDDLVAEWKEPKTLVRYINIYERDNDGDLTTGGGLYPCREQAEKYGSEYRLRCVGRRRVEFVEGEFDD